MYLGMKSKWFVFWIYDNQRNNRTYESKELESVKSKAISILQERIQNENDLSEIKETKTAIRIIQKLKLERACLRIFSSLTRSELKELRNSLTKEEHKHFNWAIDFVLNYSLCRWWKRIYIQRWSEITVWQKKKDFSIYKEYNWDFVCYMWKKTVSKKTGKVYSMPYWY